MQWFQETTKWSTPVQNHKYLLDGNRMLAYIQQGTDTVKEFKTPLRIDRRGRRFVEIAGPETVADLPQSRVRVEGSKGSVYWVDLSEKTCTCPGFIFRGSCKHVKDLV